MAEHDAPTIAVASGDPLDEALTARAEAVEALRLSEQRFGLLVDGIRDYAVLMLDHEGHVISWNASAERTKGYSAAEILGKHFSIFYPPEDVAAGRCALELERATAEGRFEQEGWRVRKDGSKFLASDIISVLRIPSGKVQGFVKLTRDLSSRALAEEDRRRYTEEQARRKEAEAAALALTKSEEGLRSQVARVGLLNQIARAISGRHDLYSLFHVVLRYLEEQFAVDGCVFYLCDPEAETITVAARGQKSSTNQGTAAFPEGSVVPAGETGVAPCLRGQPVYVADVTRASGSMVADLAGPGFRSFVGIPLVIEQAVLGVLVAKRHTANGFTPEERDFLSTLGEHVALGVHQTRLHLDLKTAYTDLRKSQDQLVQQERLRALGQMASGIAHDFNNALTPIVGFSEILLGSAEDRNNSETALRYLKMINLAAKDGARVVSHLKEFYRLREENEVFHPVYLHEVAQQSILLTQPKWKDQAQANGIDIRLETDLAEVQELSGNDADLEELSMNLILNAVDAMPKGGVLTLRTRQEAEHAVLEIADTGTGMTEEVKKRCLEPFFTTKGRNGTGLGLAMVHGIVRRHDGVLEIETEVGRGTTFRIRLPRHPAQALPTGSYKLPASSSRLRVLVVDDNEQIRELLRAYLELDGHTVELGENGKEALAKFVSSTFDLVITDRAMPHMSGDQLAVALKAFSPKTRVILLTGFGEFMGAAGETLEGVDLILGKPITLNGLRQAVARLAAID